MMPRWVLLTLLVSACSAPAQYVRITYETRITDAKVAVDDPAPMQPLEVIDGCVSDPPFELCVAWDGYELFVESRGDAGSFELDLESEPPWLQTPNGERWTLVAFDLVRLVQDQPFGVVDVTQMPFRGTRRAKQSIWPGFFLGTTVARYRESKGLRRWRLVPDQRLMGVYRSFGSGRHVEKVVQLYPLDYALVEAWGTATHDALAQCLAVDAGETWKLYVAVRVTGGGDVGSQRRYRIALGVEGTKLLKRATEAMSGELPRIAVSAPSATCPDAVVERP